MDVEKREATYYHGSKCIDCVLATEGMLSKVKGCELTECSKIVESDHRGCLIDVDFAEKFSEEFVEDEERMERNLNPKKKTHREKIAEKCDVLLDSISIENDLIKVNNNFSRAKIEQTDADVTHVLTKARKV